MQALFSVEREITELNGCWGVDYFSLRTLI